MNGNDPEFLEAIRLTKKFFPELKMYISDHCGLDWCDFLSALEEGIGFGEDWSCDPYGTPGYKVQNPEPSLEDRGGVEGSDREVYVRILEHVSFKPKGRVLIVPDTLPITGGSMEERPPFVCSVDRVLERLEERPFQSHPIVGLDRPYIFDGSSDTIFVFESGEAFLLQHDNRLFWARTRRLQ